MSNILNHEEWDMDAYDYVLGCDLLGLEAGDTRPLDEYARTVEAEFQDMKKLADKAKWPKDLTPEIKAIDAAWQGAKAAANAAKVSVVHTAEPIRERIRAMLAALQEHATPDGNNESFWTRPIVGPVPGWGVVGGCGLFGAFVALLLRRGS